MQRGNSGWNPVRRNRNIGTAKSGNSQDNKMDIPARWQGHRIYWDRLNDPVIWRMQVHFQDITLLIEAPREGSFHACTPHDIQMILQLLPSEHLAEINTIVLRQPTKKQELLNPVWGRYVYYADLGQFSGPGVHLEAVPMGKVLKWSKHVSPFEQKELKALRADGHRVKSTSTGFDIETSPVSVRNTQLFRTLPHEVGHAIDYLVHSLEPSVAAKTDAEFDYVAQTYQNKSQLDKEEAANRYAREFFERYHAAGQLPFPRIEKPDELSKRGLNPRWFGIKT